MCPGIIIATMAPDYSELAAQEGAVSMASLQSLTGLGWMERGPGFQAVCLGLAAPPFNGVRIVAEPELDAMIEVLERIAASGLPFCLESPPRFREDAEAAAAHLAMTRQLDRPLLARGSAPTVPSTELELRWLEPEEAERHVRIAAEAFGGAADVFRTLLAPSVMADPGTHVILGSVGGEGVATAITKVTDRVGWIYNVATRPARRGRGYGAAVTAAVAEKAFEHGAQAALLFSSELGLPVYSGLGFERVEDWCVWHGGADAPAPGS